MERKYNLLGNWYINGSRLISKVHATANVGAQTGVEIVEDENSGVLDMRFTIEQGPAGPTGLAGERGATGAVGPTGP